MAPLQKLGRQLGAILCSRRRAAKVALGLRGELCVVSVSLGCVMGGYAGLTYTVVPYNRGERFGRASEYNHTLTINQA